MHKISKNKFLSDLCGREEQELIFNEFCMFLSDLCGREEVSGLVPGLGTFLSDLCGREV